MRRIHKEKHIKRKLTLSGKWKNQLLQLNRKIMERNTVQKSTSTSKEILCLKQKAFKIVGRMLQSIYLVEKSKELRRNGFLGC